MAYNKIILRSAVRRVINKFADNDFSQLSKARKKRDKTNKVILSGEAAFMTDH